MKYQVTQQYARDDERLMANFTALAEAKAYITTRLEADAQQRLNIVYRLFDRKQCLQEYNKAKAGALLHEALYADGTQLLPETINHGYEVQDSHLHDVAAFYQLGDARDFLTKRLTQDVGMGHQVHYQIIKDNMLIETLDSAAFAIAQQRDEGGMASSIAFRPTPLNTSPRPSGTPPSVMDKAEENV